MSVVADPDLAAMATAAPRRRLAWFGLGLMLSLVAEHSVLFAVPLLIYQHSGSVAYAGIAFVVEWLPALVAYPFAGLLADRVGGRRLFLHANAARAACLALTLLVCWRFPDATVAALMVNSVFLSALMAPVRMAVEKTVLALGPASGLAARQSLVQNVELMAMALAPGLAAGLALWLGKLALLGLASAALLAALLAWCALPAGARALGPARRVGADLRLGCSLLIGNRPVLMLAGVNFSINLVFAVALSANAYLITGLFAASDSVFGLMNAGAGSVGLLNLLLIPRLLRRWSIYQLGAVGFTLLCAGLTGMGLAGNVGLYAGAFVLTMGGAAMFNVFNRTQRVKAIPPEHLGKVIGPFYLLNCLSYPLGGAVTALLAQPFGIQRLMLVLAGLLALPGGVLLWRTMRQFRQRLGAAAPAVASAVADGSGAALSAARRAGSGLTRS